jgi:hypothetical protein
MTSTRPTRLFRAELILVAWIAVKVVLLLLLVRSQAAEFVYAGF